MKNGREIVKTTVIQDGTKSGVTGSCVGIARRRGCFQRKIFLRAKIIFYIKYAF